MPGGPLTLTLHAATAGCSVLQIAQQELGDAGVIAVQRGGSWLDGRRVIDGEQPLPSSGVLRIHQPPDGVYRDAQLRWTDVLWADESLLVINKPAGVAVGATPWDDRGHLLAAARRLLSEHGDMHAADLQLAHQLDSGTSGVLVLVRRRPDYGAVQRLFAGGAAAKTYLALAQGVLPAAQQLVDGHGRSAHGRWRLYPLDDVGRELPGGSRVKRAELLIEQVTPVAAGSLAQIRLLTGRTHQIRLQLAGRGHALIGDTRYGGVSWQEAGVIMLHAARLQLPHPRSGALLELEAALPPRFALASACTPVGTELEPRQIRTGDGTADRSDL